MIKGGNLIRVAFGVGAFLLLVVILLLTVAGSQEKCSRTCITHNCNKMDIQYGKYCGIGYFGCRGESPCDDLDACCMTHDNCVGLKGMTYVHCHKQFQRCVKKLKNEIKRSKGPMVGFSTECPYYVVIPTVYNGMDYGIFFSKIGNIVKPQANSEPVVEADLNRSKANTDDGLGTQKDQTKVGSKVSVSLN